MDTNTNRDKNGQEIKRGDIVKIEGGYFKADNGLFRVMHAPGDSDWCGNDWCLYRMNKDGSISKSKYRTAFWPLHVTVNSNVKRMEANAHNAKHATIEVIPYEAQENAPKTKAAPKRQQSPVVATAAAIRKRLKEYFPGIKFSVRSSNYAGGNSVDVDWTDGPRLCDVENIVKQYQSGWFDGMTDSYNHKDISKDLGCPGTMFACANRRLSPEYIQNLLNVYEELKGHPYPVDGNEWAAVNNIEREYPELMPYQYEMNQQVKEEVAETLETETPKTESLETESQQQQQQVNIIPKNIEEPSEPLFITGLWAKLNKNNTLEEYQTEVDKGEYYEEKMKVEKIVTLSGVDFDIFCKNLLTDFDFIAGMGGCESDFDVGREVVSIFDFTQTELEQWRAQAYSVGAMITDGSRAILVNPEGFKYARYVGIIVNLPQKPKKQAQTDTEKQSNIIDFGARLKEKRERQEVNKALETFKKEYLPYVNKSDMDLLLNSPKAEMGDTIAKICLRIDVEKSLKGKL